MRTVPNAVERIATLEANDTQARFTASPAPSSIATSSSSSASPYSAVRFFMLALPSTSDNALGGDYSGRTTQLRTVPMGAFARCRQTSLTIPRAYSTTIRFFRVTRGEQFMHDCSTAPVPSRQGPPGKSLRTCTEDSSPLTGATSISTNSTGREGAPRWHSVALCRLPYKKEHLCRPSKRRRLRMLWDFFHAADGATPLALDRPQTVTAVQDASQHGWLNSVPLLRPVDDFEPPNATAETTPRLLGIGPSLRLKETRKKKNAKPIRSCTHAYGSVSRPLRPDSVEYW